MRPKIASLNNSLLYIILLLFGTTSMILGQEDYSAANIPDSLKVDAYSVVREHSQLLTISSNREATIKVHTVITILDSRSHQNQLPLFYNKETKVDDVHMKIYNAAGELVRKVKKEEMKDYSAVGGSTMYSDDRVKLIEANLTTLPFTIAYSYTMTLRGINFCVSPQWEPQEFHQSIQRAEFKVENQAKTTLIPQIYHCSPSTNHTNGDYAWQLTNLKAVPEEDFCPSRNDVLPRIVLAMSNIKIGDFVANTTNWKDYGAFMYELCKGKDELSDGMKDKVHDMIKGAKSDQEKVDTLYKYMQNRCRYVSVQLGIGGWQPYDAQYVETNGYGDCKALSNFMKALLKEAGIESYPTIIYGGRKEAAIDSTIGMPQFNHMILYVPSVDYWLECTDRNLPPNYLSMFTSNRQAMLITPAGGRLVWTQRLDEKINGQQRSTQITVQPNGSATLQTHVAAQGDAHDWYRNLKDLSTEDCQKALASTAKLSSPEVHDIQLTVSNTLPTATCHFGINVAKYGSKSGKRLFLPIRPLIDDTPSAETKTTARHQAVRIFLGRNNTDTVTYMLPQGFTVESYPKAETHLTSDFGTYDLNFIVTDTAITIIRNIEIYRSNKPAETYPLLVTFLKEVAKVDNQKLVLLEGS